MTEIYYDEISTVAALVDDGAVNRLTALLVSKYEVSKPYLPYVGPTEFWDLVSPKLAHWIQKGIGERHHPNLTLCWMLTDVSDSPIVALQDVANDSETGQVFAPNFTQYSKDFYWTLLTRDFIKHVLDSDSLTPYTIRKFDALLKDHEVEYEIKIPVMGMPTIEELTYITFSALVKTAENDPARFNREIRDILDEKGFDPSRFDSETIKEILTKVKTALHLR